MAVAKFFNDHDFLEKGVKWLFYLSRDSELINYFDEVEDGTSYCNNIKDLIEDLFGVVYKPEDYRLFLDSGKVHLKQSYYITAT